MFIKDDKSALDVIYKNSVRLWLTSLLLIIPFVTRIGDLLRTWNPNAASLLNRLDELTVIILLPLALFEFYRSYKARNKLEPLSLLLFLSIVLVTACGILSGVLNGNTTIVTLFGTFSYVKYFLFIFIYAAFFRDFDQFLKIFRILLIIAVVIGSVAFIQETWVIYSSYFAAKTSPYKDIYLYIGKLLGVNDIIVYGSGWRLGIYRASSLLSHYNLLGLYSLFILTIYLNIVKRVNVLIMFSLLAGVITSVSRTAYIGFLLMGGLQIFKGRRWIIVFLIPVVIALFLLGMGEDVQMSRLMEEEGNSVEYQEKLTYREHARGKALQVWKDHPLLGVGPGMFGGAIAIKFNTPYYQEYDFQMIFSWFHSLEQLWPQVLAEMGLIGIGALTGMFFTLFVVFYILRHEAATDEIKGFFTGMLVFTAIFLCYTFAGNLNIVSVLLPYCAFAGMGLGSLRLSYA